MTALSILSTAATEDSYKMAGRYETSFRGAKPTKPEAIEAKEQKNCEKIAKRYGRKKA
jgi:hypothetical protein